MDQKLHGFYCSIQKDDVVRRLEEASGETTSSAKKNDEHVSSIQKPEFFSIDPKVKEIFPSVSIGIALIRGVSIKKI